MEVRLSRRDFLARAGIAAAGLALSPYAFAADEKRLNVLFITGDDLNYDSLGVTGCKVADITPNLDRLSREGMLFEEAHLGIAVCQPSRSVWMTGRYPHRNGAMGFEPINPDVPTLQESLRAAGYFNGIFAKVPHLAPQSKFCWDAVVTAQELGNGKDPALYYAKMKSFLEQAKASGKPWFLMANCQDPHRPFPGSEQKAAKKKPNADDESAGTDKASRYYKPEEITVPGFLPDLPDIRKELAQYFTAVHRGDETVGNVLKALKEAGLEENTIVIFMSDNGISMPFSKANCYRTSTRTPLMIRWPGVVKPGSVNKTDMVSCGVDFTPTVLDALGLKQIPDVDGRSFVPILKGRKQDGRDHVFTFFNETSAKNEYPMRCIRTKKYSYIINSWSDGKTMYQAEGMSGLTFKAMEEAAKTDPKIAERVKFLRYRAFQEFCDLNADPNELTNLIADPKHKATIEKMRGELLAMMVRTKDPLVSWFKQSICK